MSQSLSTDKDPVADFYRFAPGQVKLSAPAQLSDQSGYFRFGTARTCYGKSRSDFLHEKPEQELYDVCHEVRILQSRVALPFDPSEVIENLLFERYLKESNDPVKAFVQSSLKKSYYLIRPFMPVNVRKHIQRAYWRDWKTKIFPSWPVDYTVENILEELLTLSMRAANLTDRAFIWFWPDGFDSCTIMTHDVESSRGRDFCSSLMDLDDTFGIKSSFQIVPERRYKVHSRWLDSIRSRGFEINVHGLNHDGELFSNREEFLRRAQKINQYAREYDALGFRSPVLYRNLEWYDALHFSYDMSVPNVGHLDSQQGGCCTVMPYFVGDLLEIPLTTTQDYTLFHILSDYSTNLWERQIDLIQRKHGVISFNVHPDYIMDSRTRSVYRKLLSHIRDLGRRGKTWMALPRELDTWWRQRREMRIVQKDGKLQIDGVGAERARLAYVKVIDDAVRYEVSARCGAPGSGSQPFSPGPSKFQRKDLLC